MRNAIIRFFAFILLAGGLAACQHTGGRSASESVACFAQAPGLPTLDWVRDGNGACPISVSRPELAAFAASSTTDGVIPIVGHNACPAGQIYAVPAVKAAGVIRLAPWSKGCFDRKVEAPAPRVVQAPQTRLPVVATPAPRAPAPAPQRL